MVSSVGFTNPFFIPIPNLNLSNEDSNFGESLYSAINRYVPQIFAIIKGFFAKGGSCEVKEVSDKKPLSSEQRDFPYAGKSKKKTSREKAMGFGPKIGNAILAEKEAMSSWIKPEFKDKIEEIRSSDENSVANKILDGLAEDNLLPTHCWKSGNGVNYYYTDPFEMRGTRRIAVMCFVKIKGEEKVYPRFFSLSRSQGTWRTYPQAELKKSLRPEVALPEEHVHQIGHFDKGKDEQALNLPISVNLKLHELLASTPPKKLEHFYEEDVLCKSYPFMILCKETIKEVPFCEIKSRGGRRSNRAPNNPSDCKLKEKAFYPDFSDLLFSQKLILSQYGEVTAKIYPSKNGALHYLFYETADGKTFLATVEQIKVDSGINPITNFGNRQYYLGSSQAVTSPLYEYEKQISPEYRVAGYKQNAYHLNWNYVRKSPLIRDYYLQQGRKIPGPIISRSIIEF